MWRSINSISNWMKWSGDDWHVWKEWQRKQSPLHYEKCDLFQYYLSQRPNFQPLPEAMINKSLSKNHVYCFGDFTCLINTPIGPANVAEYFRLLLDIYDVCKGMTRFIKGDPSGIIALREVVAKNNLGSLQHHDCIKYAYPYTELHAHTVCQYSLSTLIMRLVMHYMSKLTPKFAQYSINGKLCQEACDKCIFGTPLLPLTNSVVPHAPSPFNTTEPITIRSPTAVVMARSHDEQLHGSSWPRDQSTCLRCKMCKRVTEHIWGKFNCCLDCHLKRICSVCAATATIIGADDLPKCKEHQDI